MELKEKAAYLNGLADGLDYDKTTKEGKLIAALIDLVGELASAVQAHDEDLDEVVEELEDLREYIEEIPAAALEMDEGSVVRVESEYGVHFLLRVPLDEGGYAADENADFFEDFYARMQGYYFELYITQLLSQVEVDHEVLATIRYEDCEPNFDVYW